MRGSFTGHLQLLTVTVWLDLLYWRYSVQQGMDPPAVLKVKVEAQFCYPALSVRCTPLLCASWAESPPCTSPAAEDSLRLGSILAVGPSPYRSRTGLRAPNVPWNEHMCPGQWLVSRLPSLAPWPYYGLLCDRPDNIFLTEHLLPFSA